MSSVDVCCWIGSGSVFSIHLLFGGSNCCELAESPFVGIFDGKYAVWFMMQHDVIKSTTGIDSDAMTGFVISKVIFASSVNTENIIGSS